MKEISIVIPAYNEEKRIEKSLQEIIKYCKNNFQKYEVIVVDDGSKDKTREIVRRYSEKVKLVENGVNRGKGYSVRQGILQAQHGLILFSDSDLATPIKEVAKMIEEIDQGHDVVIASRNMKESDIQIKQPLYRQLLGKSFPLLVNMITLPGFKDTQCGFKLFKKEAGQKIVRLQTLERFSFDVEILFIAKKLGYKIKEVPVTWIDQPGSKVSVGRDSFKMLKDLVLIRNNFRKGRYKVRLSAN
jgi:glycosyltransferase involved in cell wall biosynthesis